MPNQENVTSMETRVNIPEVTGSKNFIIICKKLKNYFIIIFFALNSDIVMTLLAVPIIPIILFAINRNILRNNFNGKLFVFVLSVRGYTTVFMHL